MHDNLGDGTPTHEDGAVPPPVELVSERAPGLWTAPEASTLPGTEETDLSPDPESPLSAPPPPAADDESRAADRSTLQRDTRAHRPPSHAATTHRPPEHYDRMAALLRESLRSTTTVDEVADTIAAFCSDELGATWGGLLLHEHKRGSLRRIDGRTVTPGENAWASVTSSTSGPAAAAIGRRTILVFDDLAALLAEFPDVERWGRPPATGTVAFVPLLLVEGALGSAVIWWGDAHPVTPAATARLTTLARSVTLAVDRIEAAAEQREDAETLQRSLLTRLPRPDGLELHARYVPAGRGREIGGDWYDAVVLNDGSTALMIGDVTGHDMAAAAQMGQLRGLLRGFTYDRDEPPSGVVRRLDRTCAGLGIDTLATLTLARLDGAPGSDGSTRLTWTNAGHLPPVLLHTDGRTELLETEPEAMVGLMPDAERSDHIHDLPPGTTVLLYTDGLVERRDRDVRTGIDHLRAALTRLRRRPLQTMLNMLVSQVAGDQPQDDVALLAARSRWAPPSAR